jgi:hypothetical protein
MSEKIFIHYLFMPYLQKDEHLLWLGESQAPLIRLNTRPQPLKKLVFTNWRIPLIYSILYFFIPNMSQMPFAPYLFVLDYLWFILLAALLWFLLNEIFLFGKEYYAISTKRLLVLRRLLWKTVDAAPLGLLPEIRLDGKNIRFAPTRIDEYKIRGRIFRIAQHRPDLTALIDAQDAYKQLQSAKNAILDARAREIGLIK